MPTNENICTITNMAGDIFVIRKEDVSCILQKKNHQTILFTVSSTINLGTVSESVETLATYLMDE